jgi:hypothetical protein
MKHITLATVLAALALHLGGCVIDPVDGDDMHITDDSCVAACEERADCFLAAVDCDDICDQEANRGCDDEYTAAMECLNERADSCQPTDACDDEQRAFVDCIEPTLSQP